MADEKKKDEGVAADPSGVDSPGVAGDEEHRDHYNDQPAGGLVPQASYSAAEQARAAGDGGPVSGDEMVARKLAEREE